MTTPKAVILAVVIVLGLFALGALGACFVLLENGKNPTVVAVIATPMGVALGLVGGILASPRTTPEIPPGGQVTTGATTITSAPQPTNESGS
jgi:hypothetical protein